jgi:hypothetical protein
MKRLALISGIGMAAAVGAAQAEDLYGGSAAMSAAELSGATGKAASAISAAVAANVNITGQANQQGVGGACIVCDASNSNATSQSASASSSATASNTNTSSGNVNVGDFAGSQF